MQPMQGLSHEYAARTDAAHNKGDLLVPSCPKDSLLHTNLALQGISRAGVI